MKTLVVGGTGTIGGEIALHMTDAGDEVTIAGRTAAKLGTPLGDLPFLRGDYVEGTFEAGQLSPFEAVVFAAGNDIRHVPLGADYDAHSLRANAEAAPAFAALCRDAGVSRFVNIGSFYVHVAPHLADTNAYVRSRKLGVERMVALGGNAFNVCSLDAPFVVGAVPGLHSAMFQAYVAYAQGKIGLPPYGPAGGTNFISTRSLAQAAAGAVARGEAGKAYLVGDVNLSFADYFALFFRAVGNEGPVPALDQEHPLMPDSALFTGRRSVIAYEPDPEEVRLLGYDRGDVARAIADIVAQYAARD